MNKIQRATVEAKIQNGYDFDFGKYISDGFNIFTKEWLLFSLYGLVSFVIIFFSIITVFGALFFVIPAVMGYSIAAEKVERGEQLEFNDFFGAFKNFGNYAILTSIIVAIILVIYIPIIGFFVILETDSGIDGNPLIAVLGVFYYLFIYAAMYILQASVIFAPYLIHYGNYSGYDAFKESIKLFRKKFWWILLFVFVLGMISTIGYFICLVGIFASMAAGSLMSYAMAKDILMNSEHSEIDQIGTTAYH